MLLGWVVCLAYPGVPSAWGTSWSIEPTASPKDAAQGSRLEGVSCVSPTSCIADGLLIRTVYDRTWAERWNGERWSMKGMLQPSGLRPSADLDGVS